MNLLYLIGNGFDINAGLNTSAKAFMQAYKVRLDQMIAETDDPDNWLRVLHGSIESKGIETWADFEKSFGELSSDFEGCDDAALGFQNAYEDFLGFFHATILDENERASALEIDDAVLDSFKNGTLSCLADGMRPQSEANIRGVTPINENWTISFITFNYTTLLDRLVSELNKRGNTIIKYNNSTYGRAYKAPLHIHGRLDDDHGLIIGVDSENQIIGESCKSSDDVRGMLVKPEQNRLTEDMRQETAFKMIDEASVICIYGMSFGETDTTWWKKLGEWVSNHNAPNRRLVLSAIKPNLPPYKSYALPRESAKLKKLFIERSELTGSEDKLRHNGNEKILASFGTTAFDLFDHDEG